MGWRDVTCGNFHSVARRCRATEKFGRPTLRLAPHPLSLSPSEGERETSIGCHTKSLPSLHQVASLNYGCGKGVTRIARIVANANRFAEIGEICVKAF
jgi:hypothetical protein